MLSCVVDVFNLLLGILRYLKSPVSAGRSHPLFEKGGNLNVITIANDYFNICQRNTNQKITFGGILIMQHLKVMQGKCVIILQKERSNFGVNC